MMILDFFHIAETAQRTPQATPMRIIRAGMPGVSLQEETNKAEG
jgi:hypothetical protein